MIHEPHLQDLTRVINDIVEDLGPRSQTTQVDSTFMKVDKYGPAGSCSGGQASVDFRLTVAS